MPFLPLSPHGTTPHERLLGHNPAVLDRWLALERALFSSPTFDPALREQVRRALAFGNRCEYCMARGGPPDRVGVDTRIGLATAFADLVGQDHRSVGAPQLDVLREAFTDAEIAELTALACFITAGQMFGAILGLRAEDLPAAR